MVNKAVDFQCMCCFLAWNTIKTVKNNFLDVTRYADKILRLPLLHHYKSIFSSFNGNCMDKVYVTDTLFSNVESHNGYTCAQIYCENKSSFTHVFGMKT